MKAKIFATIAVGMMMFSAGSALSGEYQCTIYCVNPSGSTVATIRAGSSTEAASIADKSADQICRSAGHRAATSQSMSSSQCR